MILGEAMVISVVAGICGIFVGWLVLSLVNLIFSGQDDLIGNLAIDIETTFFSMIIVMLAGLLSGLRPAHMAAYMNTINALQSE